MNPSDNNSSSKEKVNLFINDKPISVPPNTTLLEASRSLGIEIPTLCYLKDINPGGNCRICLVEVDNQGKKTLQASCVYPVAEGLKVYTNSFKARKARQRILELILSDHDMQCPTCAKNLNCELQKLAQQMGIRKVSSIHRKSKPVFKQNCFIQRNYNKCINCRRCEAVCRKVQGVNVYSAQNRGFDSIIAPAFGKDLSEVNCIGCGQCVLHCPTASLVEKEYIEDVWQALSDPEKTVIVQTAPAVEISIGENLSNLGFNEAKDKLPAALRRLGFDYIFSTTFAADLTTIEESHELLQRLEKGDKLPLISSCSPGWVRFCEYFYPEFVDNLSSCKSPMEMLGALCKNYFAPKIGLESKNIVVVAIMPCTAKKFEAQKPEMVTFGNQDVDYVLTTRELEKMIYSAGLRWDELPKEDYDKALGISSGAGNLFATTGGVTESVIRTALALAGEKEEPKIIFQEVRGLKGIKESVIKLKNKDLKIAIAHGTSNAKLLLEKIKAGAHYDFLEIMACPGGCVGGGGQPISINRKSLLPKKKGKKIQDINPAQKRANELYKIDLNKTIRKAHENPAIRKLYEEYLDYPLSPKAKEILHVNKNNKKDSFVENEKEAVR